MKDNGTRFTTQITEPASCLSSARRADDAIQFALVEPDNLAMAATVDHDITGATVGMHFHQIMASGAIDPFRQVALVQYFRPFISAAIVGSQFGNQHSECRGIDDKTSTSRAKANLIPVPQSSDFQSNREAVWAVEPRHPTDWFQ
jgi:hypothetical protein